MGEAKLRRILDVHVPPSACTHCGRVMDMATNITGGNIPEEGSIGLCIKCSHVMVYDSSLRLRNPNDEEMVEIAGNESILKAVAILAKAKKEYEKKNGEGSWCADKEKK
jgi:hypothetical protein